MKKGITWLAILALSASLSGCVVVSVATGAVGAAVSVVDAVTPDIID